MTTLSAALIKHRRSASITLLFLLCTSSALAFDQAQLGYVKKQFMRFDLSNANLIAAELYGANLKGANLEAAKLQRANLNRANLQGANLSMSNLQKAELKRANLQGEISKAQN